MLPTSAKNQNTEKMKRLLFERNEGGNYPSSHYYYTFDSEEEYKAFEQELRDKESHTYKRFDAEIKCGPRVVVSDGFAQYGGKIIKGKGCEEWSSGRFMSWNYYYINPVTIEQFEDAKTQSWWV